MSGTQVRADRSTIVVDGTNKYQIIATCVIKGTLPDTGIFLLEIKQPVDPKNDVLKRIIAIADTPVYLTNRDAAVAAKATAWRSNQLVLQYTDVEAANAAWIELSARINTLVRNVDTYLDQFETSGGGDLVIFPTTDVATKERLIAEFLASAGGIAIAEDARDTEQADCADKTAALAVVDARLLEARTDLDLYLTISAQLSAYNATLAGIQATTGIQAASARSAVQTSSATAGEKIIIDAFFVAIDAQLVTFNATNAALLALQAGQVTTAVSTLQSRVASLSAERNALLSDLNRCHAEVQLLQATLDRARATRDAALATVRAVCPDYVPPTGA